MAKGQKSKTERESIERRIAAQLDKVEKNFNRDLAQLRELLQVLFYRRGALSGPKQSKTD